MKITVQVAGEAYEVEIADVHARPVRARIGDEVFEVYPEAAAGGAPAAPAPAQAHKPAPRPRSAAATPAAGPNVVLAPLPGVLLSVAVQPGEEVTVGQPLCVLEAMKMNNTIRAARSGRIAAVRATVGQAVQHRQVLLEYAAAEVEQG
jgi:biotin carboxyl carrier protein